MVAPKCLSFVRLAVVAVCTPVPLFASECGDMCRSLVTEYRGLITDSKSYLANNDASAEIDKLAEDIETASQSFFSDVDEIHTFLHGYELDYGGIDEWPYNEIYYVANTASSSLGDADYNYWVSLENIKAQCRTLSSQFKESSDTLNSQLDQLSTSLDGVDCSACDSTSSEDPDDPDDPPSGGGGGDDPSGGQCSCTCSSELADIGSKIAAVKTSVDSLRADLEHHKQELEAIRQLLYDIKGVIDQIKDHQKRIDDYLYDDLTEKLKELKELLEEMRDNVKEYYDDFKKVQMMALTNSVNEVRKLNEKKFNTLINMISNNIPFLRDFVTMVSNNLAGIQQGFYTNELLLTATTGQLERIASLIPTNCFSTRDYFINLNYSNAVFYLDNEGNSFSIADLDDTLNQSTNSFDWAEFAKLPWFTRMEYLMLKLAGIYEGSVSNADVGGQMDGKETLEQQEDDLKDRADSLSQAFDDCVDAGQDFINSFKSFTQRGEAVNKLHLLSDFIDDEPLEVDVDGELVSTIHALMSLWWTVFFSYVLVVFCWRTFRFWFYFSLYMYRWIMGVVL